MTVLVAKTGIRSRSWHQGLEDQGFGVQERTFCGSPIIAFKDAACVDFRDPQTKFCRSCVNKAHAMALDEMRQEEEFRARLFSPKGMAALERDLRDLEKKNPQVKAARERLDEAARKLFDEVHEANKPIRKFIPGEQ